MRPSLRGFCRNLLSTSRHVAVNRGRRASGPLFSIVRPPDFTINRRAPTTSYSLNFANIIALPLLLGVGVAFKIYCVMAWRAGETKLLQSSLTRAVFFSAMTTATAFGSLWFSKHPYTSSMGKLMALSLVSTLAAAVLFQPALMGPPREAHVLDAKGRG